MDEISTPRDKPEIWRKDCLFACSILIVACVFATGLAAASLWKYEQWQDVMAAHATSTAVVHATEQAQYDWTDTFDMSVMGWRAGSEDNDYWKGDIRIVDGVYLWDVTETKDTFISRADFPINRRVKDFDVYVDVKVLEASPGDVCSGFVFRESPDGWDEGAYEFILCNNSWVNINYQTEKDGWERMASFPYTDQLLDWNRLEISARESHFTFFINGNQIYEMDDDRQPVGGLALVVEVNEMVPVKVAFDNFGYQPR